MRDLRFRLLTAALAASAILVAHAPAAAVAEDAAGTAAGEVAEAKPTARAWDLIEQAQVGIDEVLALDAEIGDATGEQRDVLIEQQRQKRRAAGATLQQLVDEVVALRERGVVDEAANAKLDGFLARALAWNDEHLASAASELERLAEAREEATGEERLKIEARIGVVNTEYDDLLAGRLGLCRGRESIERDASADYARLDQLLSKRAESRAGQVRLTRSRIADYDRKAATAQASDATALREEIARLEDLLTRRTASLQTLIGLMNRRGMDTAAYRQLLITATGEITTDIFRREVAIGLLRQWWAGARAWLATAGPSLLFKLIFTAVILLAFHVTGRLGQRLVRRALDSQKVAVSRLLQDFALHTTYRIVLGLGVLIALSQMGVKIGPLLAGLGVAGFIVGFALQDTLSNFASGMMILAYRPYDVGDFVVAGGVSGMVAQMTLVTTTIRTFDNQRLIVPNSKIWGDVITNVTAENVRRVDLVFGISYSDDIEHAERVLRDIVDTHPKVLEEPPPTIKLHELGDSSVNFVVRPWAKTIDYWDVYWDVTREVKRRFDVEGITIPFPQRDVHLHRSGAGASGDQSGT